MATKISFFQKQWEYGPQPASPSVLNSPGEENSPAHFLGLLRGQVRGRQVFAFCSKESGLLARPRMLPPLTDCLPACCCFPH